MLDATTQTMLEFKSLVDNSLLGNTVLKEAATRIELKRADIFKFGSKVRQNKIYFMFKVPQKCRHKPAHYGDDESN